MDQSVSLTELVRRMQHGDRQASNSLFAAAAQRLRSISQSLLSREPATAGFDASDLVQEVYGQKLIALKSRTAINNREHFFSLVANGMRQVLTDRARSKNALKRQAPFGQHRTTHHAPHHDLVSALQKLEKLDPLAHQIVRLKNDHGFTWEEVHSAIRVPPKRARAEYNHAIHWLRDQLK